MTHVRQTKHGYELKLHIGDNKYESRSIRAPHTKAGRHEAERIAADWQVQHDRSRQDLTSTPTIGQLAHKWQRVNQPSWSESHARLTKQRLNSHILPYWGDRLIMSVKLLEVQDWFAGLTRLDGEPMKPASLATYKATMSGLFDFAVEHGYAQKNLAKSVRLPKINRDKPLPDADRIRQLVRGTTDPRWHTFAHLMAVTGMRRGEACALRWSDIHDGEVRIRHAATVKRTIKTTKSARGLRTVPLHKVTIKKLESLRAERPYHSDDSYIFSSDHDGARPLGPDTASQWFAKNRRDDSMTLHDLRHHAASQMLGHGVDVATVASILGQDPSTTFSVYAHAIPQNANDAVALLVGLV